MPVRKAHFCPLRANTPRQTKNAVAQRFTNRPINCPLVPNCMAMAAANSVTPSPPRNSHWLPLIRLTVLTTDKPPIRNSQFAPLCSAAVVSACAAALAVGNGSMEWGDDSPRPLMVLTPAQKLVCHYAHKDKVLARNK